MNYALKKKFFLYIFTFFMLCAIECMLNIILFNKPFSDYGLLVACGYLAILAPMLFIPTARFSMIYSFVILALFDLLFFLNISMDYVSNDIFSVQYVLLAGDAGAVFNVSFINWSYILYTFILICVEISGVIVISKFCKPRENEKRKAINFNFLAFGLLSIVACVIFTGYSLSEIKNDNEDSGIYGDMSGSEIITFNSAYLKRSSLKKYGVVSYSVHEVMYLANNAIHNEEVDEIGNYLSGDALDRTPVTDDYYGLLDGYNVVEIMVETGVNFAISEELTPNLYKLQNEGLNFTNCSSKNKTNRSEFISLMGSLTPEQNKEYKVNYSLPNLLKKQGYYTQYYHANDNIYNRDKLMPTYGIDNTVLIDDVDSSKRWSLYDGNYPLDSWFMGEIVNDFIPEKSDTPFFSYWTTLSTHGPYNTGKKNMAKFTELGYYDKLHTALSNGKFTLPYDGDDSEVIAQIENFICEYMNLDEAIGIMLKRLEETNQLDNTLIILFGDHEPYYQSNSMYPLKSYVYNLEENTNSYPAQYNTLLTMYNKKLTNLYCFNNGTSKAEYKTFTSPYAIVPTVLELMGIAYNPKLYVGTSVFQVQSEYDNIFYSHELKCIFNDKMLTTDCETFDYVADDVTDEEKEVFIEYSQRLIKKIDIFDNIYLRKFYGNSKANSIIYDYEEEY